MYRISSTLTTLVLREAAKERLSEPIRGCPKEFEDAVYRELAELHRTRPRLVAFAPMEALKRVLTRPDVHRCLGSHAQRQPAPSRLTVTARGMATKVALGALAATLIAGAAGPAIAGVSHQERLGGHDARTPQHEVSASGKRKRNASKTVKKTFTNVGEIAIPALAEVDAFGPADPYPSAIDVAGFKKAKITDVNIILRGFSHEFPAAVDVLLVAPGGRNAVVMGDVGNVDPNEIDPEVADLTLTLDDEAAKILPADELLTSGTFRPFDNLGPVDSDRPSLLDFPDPAPTPSGSEALSSFDGINPNGQWQLFVLDDSEGNAGNLANGWSLQITAKSKVKNKGKRKH